MDNSILAHRSVANGKGGRFASLTPELDREQEAWETVLAFAHSRIARLERECWERRRAAEEAFNYGVEVVRE